MDAIDELRRKAHEQAVDRLNPPSREKAQRTAKNDLYIWIDAIDRAQKRGAQELKLYYDTLYDRRLDRERAERLAPLLTKWDLFCSRELYYEGFHTYYAYALEELLGPPFKVRFDSDDPVETLHAAKTAGISSSWLYFRISWS